MGTLRLPETRAAYDAFQQEAEFKDNCQICLAPSLQEFTYWRIIKNKFPYDKIAGSHDMLVPKRHVTEKDLTQEEWKEFEVLKHDELHPNYHFIMEATHKMKSIPAHYHLHMITLKD